MRALLLVALIAPATAAGVEYDCKVDRKVDSERVYTRALIRKGQFSVRISDDGKTASITRCSFTPSQRKVTCSTLGVNQVAEDEVAGDVVDGKILWLKIKKFYRYNGQLDVQVFPDLSFVENDGRRGIAFGKCRIVSP